MSEYFGLGSPAPKQAMNETWTCDQCGQANADWAQQCGRCDRGRQSEDLLTEIKRLRSIAFDAEEANIDLSRSLKATVAKLDKIRKTTIEECAAAVEATVLSALRPNSSAYSRKHIAAAIRALKDKP